MFQQKILLVYIKIKKAKEKRCMFAAYLYITSTHCYENRDNEI